MTRNTPLPAPVDSGAVTSDPEERRNAVEALRLKLLDNGFVPLPNVAKMCLRKGWPRMEVDEAAIRNWTRSRKFTDTGIRLENGLAVIDVDIDDPAAVAAIVERIEALLPGSLMLVRHGNGAKIAIFVRTDEEFGRLHSRAWTRPGETEDDGAHRVEIFGGGSARQFGAFGQCSPGRVYRWADRSPLDTKIDELPVLTKKQFFLIVDTVEAVLIELGWEMVKRSTRGENASRTVRDLTDGMQFECNDGVTRTLADLKQLASTGRYLRGLRLRCSASWLEGPSARRTDRCLIGATENGLLTIWVSSSDVTHMPKPVEIDMAAVLAKISRAKEFLNVRRS